MKKIAGFTLPFVMLMLSLMALLIYGLMQLVILNQANSARYKDTQLAEGLAYQAIFGDGGAVDKINSFENQLWTTESGQQRLDDILDMAKRKSIVDSIFTNNCGSGTAYTGFCSSANADNGYSEPWLRVSDSSVSPCTGSYRLQTVDSKGNNLLPILDNTDKGKEHWSISYDTGNTSLCAQPRYMLELLDYDFNITGITKSARLYRVTSRAFGTNGTTVSTYQAYFFVRCSAANNCYASLLSVNLME